MVMLNNLKQLLLLFTVAIFNCSQIFAQGTGTKEDPYLMEDGGEYAFKVYKNFYGIFTVPANVTSDNVVLEIVADNWTDIYADEALTNLVSTTTGNFAPYTSTVEIAKGTKAGTAFYIYSDFPMNSGYVKVSYGGGSALELKQVTPAEGSTIAAGACYVGFEFSKPIRFDKCTMKIGSVEKNVEANQIDRFVSVEAKSELMESYKSGLLKQGDDIFFILHNVTSYDGKSNIGNVAVHYMAAAKPVTLVASTNTPESGMLTIKSWMPTNKDEGLVRLTFDGKLKRDATISASLSFGNQESEDPGEYYTEAVAPTFVNDSTLEFDLRGTLRLPSLMVNSGTNYESMLLTIRGVKDEHGYNTFVEGSGSSGSYFINYGFEVINYSLLTEFMPATGTNIDNINEITIWIQETGGSLTYSGATFNYVYKNENMQIEVPIENIKTEVDEEDNTAHYLTIPIPQFSRDPHTQVSFTLKEVSYPDGLNHSEYLTATYTTQGHEVPTGINVVLTPISTRIYTVDGKTVNSPLKANTLYIINGKKTLIK